MRNHSNFNRRIIAYWLFATLGGMLITGCTSGSSGGGAFILGSSNSTSSTATTPSPSPGGSVTAASPTPTPAAMSNYQKAVLNDKPTYYWRLDESSGTTFKDSVGNNDGTMAGNPSLFTLGVKGAINNDSDTALGFPGGSYVSTSKMIPGPNTFTVEFWFKTNNPGGRLVGFGNAKTGTSTHYDRQFYMDSAGDLIFGVDVGGGTNGIDPIGVQANLADNKWHYVVGTCCGGNNGINLYVDGNLVAQGDAPSAENYSGYWRFGYDNLNSWPFESRYAYYGDLDEVAIYGKILTSTQVMSHFVSSQ